MTSKTAEDEKEELKVLLRQKKDESSKFVDYFQQDEDKIERNYFKDCAGTLNVDNVYMYQDYQATRTVLECSIGTPSPPKLLDIASRLETALFFSHTCEVTYVEPRVNSLFKELKANGEWCAATIPSFELRLGEAQLLPFEDNSYDIITCLHALEHFGLGRYGDELDYYGDQKALKEFHRVLKPGGKLILSVPFGVKTEIEFNRQRLYHPDTIDCMLEDFGFEKEKDLVIMPFEAIVDGGIHPVIYLEKDEVIRAIQSEELEFNSDKIPNSVYYITAIKAKENSK